MLRKTCLGGISSHFFNTCICIELHTAIPAHILLKSFQERLSWVVYYKKFYDLSTDVAGDLNSILPRGKQANSFFGFVVSGRREKQSGIEEN